MLNFVATRLQRGAAIVEFQIVALLALLPMTLGILQSALLLSASHCLEFATFAAARAGAMENASATVMQRALAKALVPMHATTADEITAQNVVGIVGQAYARSLVATLLHARFEVLSPSAEAYADFGVVEAGIRLIRNDALEHRSNLPGRQSGLSIQEANLLHLRVTYCQELIVPLVNRLLLATLRRLDPEPAAQLCYLQGRVPLVAESSVNMQSDAHQSAR